MVEQNPHRLDHVFRALADPTRRKMLRRLTEGELSVGELAAPCNMSFAAASKHIKTLENAGLVRRRISGRTHRFRLKPDVMVEAYQWLGFYERFWTERLDALEAALKTRDTNDEDTA